VDINFKKYFSKQLSSWDVISKRVLDPARKSYQEKFCKNIKKLIKETGIIVTVRNIGN